MGTPHKSVLYKEVLEALAIKKGKTYVDATLDGGGHAKGILERGGAVLGVDIDPEAVKHVAIKFAFKLERKRGFLTAQGGKLTITQGNFADIRQIASRFGVWGTAGVLFDLGLSSLQLDEATRGFSFSKLGPLDMRMDPALAVTAADLINSLTERELNELFTKFGEEPSSRRITRAIVKARINKKIETTGELSEIIQQVVGKRGKIHPATRAFQALRIAVNDELGNLKKGLEGATYLLGKKGRLVVISFHSLEDRIVKNFFRESSDLKILTKRPIVPTEEEVLINPRSRSAKMRVAEKQ
ncbi:MAG TPA: 16S rRNA (cytosine(1402)-N(4))-methyltransferase RsmH [Candidatus Nanoarchaeia archaeon]